jgi:replication-associated recombination protein RarA
MELNLDAGLWSNEMKTRQGFVSNSSSSSFILPLKYLNQEQLNAIINHAEEGRKLDLEYTDWEWDIEIEKDNLKGSTWMDNFDMRRFLTLIGVDTSKAKWSDHGSIYIDWDSEDET